MTTEKAPERSLHRKLSQVMHEVGRIPKNGTAPREMGGYKFVQVGDAADAIRAALAEKLITMMPTAVQLVGQQDRPTKSGGSMTTVDLIVTWTLTDGESGETIEIQSFGAGADGGDKYSGKASTSAMKYALLSGFLLSTGEDSELGGPEAGQRPATVNGGPPPEHPPATPPDVETETLVGNIPRRAGTVKRRDGKEPLQASESPDGHTIIFRLETKDGHVPQVVVSGPAGQALWLACSMEPDKLVDHGITVKGRLFNVTRPGRRGFMRLHVSEWSFGDWQYPARDIAPGDELPLEEPPEDISLFGEKVSA